MSNKFDFTLYLSFVYKLFYDLSTLFNFHQLLRMAMFELNLLSTLCDEANEELQAFFLNYYRMSMGFLLCCQFTNTQSFLDWSFSLCFIDMILKRVIQFLLEFSLPVELYYLYQNKRLSEFLSLACLSWFFQQSLLILLFTKTIYSLFYIFCQLFSHQPLQTVVLSYYFNDLWLIVPLLAKTLLSFFFIVDAFFSLQILKKMVSYPFFLTLLKEFGIQSTDVMHLCKTHLIRFEESYQYQALMMFQKIKIDLVLASFDYKVGLNKLKQDLEQRYHQKPATYTDRDGQVYQLPLDWQHLSYFLTTKDEYQSQEIIRAYYQHPVHTVWRMLQLKNPWCDKRKEYVAYHQFFLKKDYLQWFVYFWQEEHALLKTDNFIKALAKLYRIGNQEKKIEKGGLVHVDDNLLADSPGNEEAIQTLIIGYLETSIKVNILTEKKLKVHLHQFIKHVWEKRLMAFTKIEFNQFSSIWKSILEQDALWFMFADKYPGLELNIKLKKEFEDVIFSVYGDILKQYPEFFEIIDAFFSSQHQHDIEHHAVSFSQAIANVSRLVV